MTESKIPRICGPIADSYMIERGRTPHFEWLTPEREWQSNIFKAARFELDEYEKAEWWLKREIEDGKPEELPKLG